MDLLFMDGGREHAIEMRAGALLNGLSGGIAVLWDWEQKLPPRRILQ